MLELTGGEISLIIFISLSFITICYNYPRIILYCCKCLCCIYCLDCFEFYKKYCITELNTQHIAEIKVKNKYMIFLQKLKKYAYFKNKNNVESNKNNVEPNKIILFTNIRRLNSIYIETEVDIESVL
jgi:hypothetical protein